MRSALTRFRDVYGSHPLHLLVMLTGFAVLGYIVATFTPAALWNREVWWKSIAVWFAAAVVAHDLVLYPAYALADRLLGIPADRRRARGGQPLVPSVNFICIPTMTSALLLLVFLPGIIKQGAFTYNAATGMTQDGFLGRWLLLTAALFGISAVAYAIRLSLARKGKEDNRANVGAGDASPG